MIEITIHIRAGTRFSAGADITGFGTPPVSPWLPEVVDVIEASVEPVVVAIHGTALGSIPDRDAPLRARAHRRGDPIPATTAADAGDWRVGVRIGCPPSDAGPDAKSGPARDLMRACGRWARDPSTAASPRRRSRRDR